MAGTTIVNTGVDTLVDAEEIDGDVQPLPSRISQSSEQSYRSLIDDDAARVTRDGTSCQRGTGGKSLTIQGSFREEMSWLTIAKRLGVFQTEGKDEEGRSWQKG